MFTIIEAVLEKSEKIRWIIAPSDYIVINYWDKDDLRLKARRTSASNIIIILSNKFLDK